MQRRWTKCRQHEGRHALHGKGPDASNGTRCAGSLARTSWRLWRVVRSDEPNDGHAAKHADAGSPVSARELS